MSPNTYEIFFEKEVTLGTEIYGWYWSVVEGDV
ncbi:hypothetical protein ES703_58414 [subsurface metagenome]